MGSIGPKLLDLSGMGDPYTSKFILNRLKPIRFQPRKKNKKLEKGGIAFLQFLLNKVYAGILSILKTSSGNYLTLGFFPTRTFTSGQDIYTSGSSFLTFQDSHGSFIH